MGGERRMRRQAIVGRAEAAGLAYHAGRTEEQRNGVMQGKPRLQPLSPARTTVTDDDPSGELDATG